MWLGLVRFTLTSTPSRTISFSSNIRRASATGTFAFQSALKLSAAAMSTTTTTTATTSKSALALAEFASIDLKGYDAEQARLMDERCIVVDEQDNAIGALDKKTCKSCSFIPYSSCARQTRYEQSSWNGHALHTASSSTLNTELLPRSGHLMENINKGLLHRAFSAFVFRPSDGRLLLQKRAAEKITFANMWTNTCCSHPLDDFEQEKVEKDQLGQYYIAAT